MLRAVFKLVLILLAALILFAVWMNWPVKLSSSGTLDKSAIKLINKPSGRVKVKILESGYLESLHAFSVRGGRWETYRSGIMSILIQHPLKGNILIDGGFGRNVQAHFQQTPALMQKTSKMTVSNSTVDLLAAEGLNVTDIAATILTHSHWDHTSGLEDLVDIPVYLGPGEQTFLTSGHPAVGAVANWADKLTIKTLPLAADRPTFSSAFDWFGDGSVLIFSMSGHTPGSLAVLVTADNGKRYLFIGDTSWTGEGVEWPAEKPYIAKKLADYHADNVASRLEEINAFQRQFPNITVVPAHDRRIYQSIP